jgi:Mg-chelatase subunit ChlD
LAAVASVRTAQVQAAAEAAGRPRVEAVFVLDTTGSMGNLIQAAKEKIWAIANTMASAKPVPEIKMGLVGYRDRGDAYVTKLTPLTDDLDAVYSDLMAFRADGGGDGPESVNQALHEAVTRIGWSTDRKTYRVIFLVGDYPPHMDYDQDVPYPASCKAAATAGIIINTIQCGNHSPTTPVWREIAANADGRFFQVEQSGGAILADTPFDAELAELSRSLDTTRVYYGSSDVQARQQARDALGASLYSEAGAKALAQRAEFNAGKAGARNFMGEQELVQDLADGKVKLAEVKDEELPESLRKLPAEEREKFVQEKAAERKALQDKIQDLAAKRRAHIEGQMRKSNAEGKTGFDLAVFECLKEQAARAGIQYGDEPTH